MGDETIQLGQDGEQVASLYLRSCGWDILHNNWRFERGEIDIIGRRMERRYGMSVEVLVFVEVKTRRVSGAYAPEDAVDFRKRQTIIRGASIYMQQHQLHDVSVRFDVIGLIKQATRYDLRHQKCAFDASGVVF